MNFKKISLLFVFICLTLISFSRNGIASTCQVCSNYESANICFVSTKMGLMTPLANLSVSDVCGKTAKVFRVDNGKQIFEKLDELSQSCVRISKMIFFSHGDNNELRNMVKSEEWKYFKQFSCVMQNHAQIDTRACNIGKGCDGALQMYRMANSLLNKNNGTILSPTFLTFAVSGRPESLLHLSDRLLQYSETLSGKSIEFVNEKNPSIVLNDQVRQQCLAETKELLEITYRLKTNADQPPSPECRNKLDRIESALDYLNINLTSDPLNDFFETLPYLEQNGFKTFKQFKKYLTAKIYCR